MPSESNDHGPPNTASVSTNPNVPPSGRRPDPMHVAAVLGARSVEQARRHQREQGEADDGQRGHRRQRVAPLRKDVLAPEVEQQEHTEGDHEVGGAVEHVHRLDQPPLGQEPLLDRLLVEQADQTFEADHPSGVVERVERERGRRRHGWTRTGYGSMSRRRRRRLRSALPSTKRGGGRAAGVGRRHSPAGQHWQVQPACGSG